MKRKKEEKKKTSTNERRAGRSCTSTKVAKLGRKTKNALPKTFEWRPDMKGRVSTRCDDRGWFFVMDYGQGLRFEAQDRFETKEQAREVGKASLKVGLKMLEKYALEAMLKKLKNPLPETCAACGLDYDDFKTGLTFAAVRADMWRTEEDPSQWKYKRRRGVLGAWHGTKQMMWRDHLDTCEAAAAEKKKKSKKPTKKEIEKLKKGLEKEFKKKKDDDEVPF